VRSAAATDLLVPAHVAGLWAEYQLEVRVRDQRWECGYFGDDEDEDDGVIGTGASPGDAIEAAVETLVRARAACPQA
jgi:hypothetical protein